MFLATMKNDTAKEAEIGKEININILTGIGNVMMASSKDAKITEDGEKSAVDREKVYVSGPYLGFFVCGGKLGFREISDQYSYKKQPSKIRHYVRKKTFSFPGGGNCPLRPPAMYGPVFNRVLERCPYQWKTKQDANGQPNTYLKAFNLNLFVAIITKKTEQLAEVKSLDA